MGSTQPCVLLLLSALLYSGHTQDLPKATVRQLPGPAGPLYPGTIVTLQCDISQYEDWSYIWYKWFKVVPSETSKTISLNVTSGAAHYFCEGFRGGQPSKSSQSAAYYVTAKALPRAKLTVTPNSVYSGETVSMECSATQYQDWEFTWSFRDKDGTWSGRQHIHGASLTISQAQSSDRGWYKCTGKRGSIPHASQPSNMMFLSVIEPVLRVSPSWLNPGDSVTLSCKFGDSSTGWRFFFYRAVPYTDGLTSLSDKSYSLKLLSDSKGTAWNYTLNSTSPTLTGRYVCGAGRGETVYPTSYSKPQLLWSGDLHSSVSLSVSSKRPQHLISESLSLSCGLKGNSTGWKLKMFPDRIEPGCPSSQGPISGSTCNISSLKTQNSGVYWCESGLGEVSNAVNITVPDGPVILESPVHPATEGDSVILRCKHKSPPLNPKVDFNKDGKRIRSETTGEMRIPAVSLSDQGLYECQYSDSGKSPESWLTVRAAGEVNTSAVPLVFVLVVPCTLLVIIIVLSLGYRKVKGSRSYQSSMSPQHQSTNQDPLQHDQDTDTGPSGVIDSQLDIENLDKSKRKTRKPSDLNDSTVYSEVATGAAQGGDNSSAGPSGGDVQAEPSTSTEELAAKTPEED